MTSCELIRFRTVDGIRLTGALFGTGRERLCIMHVHGSCGNFYEAEFVHALASSYASVGIAMFSINLRTSNCIMEGYGTKGDFRYIGGSIERFSTCLEDMTCAAKVIERRGLHLIALQGHSLGCDRVIFYQLQNGTTLPSILLSPCDSYALQREYIEPETIPDQIKRLQQSSYSNPPTIALLSASEYGVNSPKEKYHTPITKAALLSIIEGPPFQLLRHDPPAKPWRVECSACVILGGKDNLQTHKPSQVERFMEGRFQKVVVRVLPNSDHDFAGEEVEVATIAALWIREQAK